MLFWDDGRIEVVGLHDRVDLPLLEAGARIRGIRLLPHVVGATLRTDASSLRNCTVPLEDVLGSGAARRLLDPRGREDWLNSIQPKPRTAHAVHLLATHSVEVTARSLGISSRHLRRLLIAEVGLAPKVLQRVMRMQRFLSAAARRTGLADAAADAGYADQPHLTREVRALTGVTPTRLVQEWIRPLHSLQDGADQGQ